MEKALNWFTKCKNTHRKTIIGKPSTAAIL